MRIADELIRFNRCLVIVRESLVVAMVDLKLMYVAMTHWVGKMGNEYDLPGTYLGKLSSEGVHTFGG